MTGQQGGSAIGGILGGYFGGPVGFAVGSMVGGIGGGMLFPIKGPHQTVTGPRLGDLTVQASSYGGPIPLIYGTFGQLAGNVIWATDILETSHSTTTSSGGGGKGGPPSQTTTSIDFTYSVSMAVAVAAGPIGGVKRVWANGKLVWDATNPIPGGPLEGFRVYFGDEDQVADPTIEAHRGVGNVPGYRGLAYCVFTSMQLAEFGNSVPNLTFELIGDGDPYISTAGTVTTAQGIALQGTSAAIDTATGLIWLTHWEQTSPGHYDADLLVIRPDTWEVIKTVALPESGGASGRQPRGIVYQPQYIHAVRNAENVLVIEQTLVNGRPTRVTTPARMWVGDANNENRIWFIDTDTYFVTELTIDSDNSVVAPRAPLDGVWPGTAGGLLWGSAGIAIDISPIDSSNGVANGPVRVVAGGTARIGANPVTGAVGFWTEFMTIDTTLDTPSFGMGTGGQAKDDDNEYLPIVYNESLTGSGCTSINSFTHGDTCIYIIDGPGTIYQLEGMNVSASYAGFATPGATSSVANHVTYDTAEGFVYAVISLSGHTHILKLSADLSTLVWSRDMHPLWCTDLQYQQGSGQLIATVHDSGTNAAGGDTSIHIINPVDGTSAQSWPTDLDGGLPGFSLAFPNASFMVTNNEQLETVKVPTVPVASGTVTLATIASDLSVRAGLTTGDINVTALAAVLVDGFAVTTRTTVRAALEPLQRAFFFDVMESDSKVKFILRGTASVVTIPYTDVAAYDEGSQPPDPLAQSRAQEVDLPHELEVSYLDNAADYRVVTQYSRRLIGATSEKQSVQLPVACTGAYAILVANVLLYDAWTSRMTYSLTVARKYAYLDPTDVITYQDADGILTVMRITKVDYSLPLLLKLEAVREDTSVYAGFLYAAGGGGYVAQTITSAVPTRLLLKDWPLLRDGDDGAGFYVAGNGLYDGWTGAIVHRSLDEGASYHSFARLTSEATTGAALTVLSTTTAWEVWDDTNTVDVTMFTGTIATAVDDLAVYAGGNAAMLGSELIQFGTVTALGGGTYRLSHLLRGRNGTEWATNTHEVGEDFIVITSFTEIVRADAGLGDVNLARLYKGVSPGQYINDAPSHTFTNTGVSLKPYAPVSVAGTRDGSFNLTATWIRRTRISGGWADSIDVPLGEDTESYSIDVMDGPDVVRTLTSATETVAYSAANQTTDFGSAQPAITLNIYQVSAQIGRGYAATATV